MVTVERERKLFLISSGKDFVFANYEDLAGVFPIGLKISWGGGMAGRGKVGCAHKQDTHTTGRQVCMVSLSAFDKTVLAAEAL